MQACNTRQVYLIKTKISENGFILQKVENLGTFIGTVEPRFNEPPFSLHEMNSLV